MRKLEVSLVVTTKVTKFTRSISKNISSGVEPETVMKPVVSDFNPRCTNYCWIIFVSITVFLAICKVLPLLFLLGFIK